MTTSVDKLLTIEQEVEKMLKNNVHIIFNPVSAGGKTAEKKDEILNKIEKHFPDTTHLSETKRKGHATELVKKAVDANSDIIVAVGGDGTISEVVNGLFENGQLINPDVKLGVISCGTGQGFADSLSIKGSLDDQIKVILNGSTRKIDVGKITFGRKKSQKYFINEFQLGIGAEVNKNISNKTKKFFGRFAFGASVIKTLFYYHSSKMEIVLDHRIILENLMGLVISNGHFTGGGMLLTPDAEIDDGLFDVLLIYEMPVLKRLHRFTKIYSGSHLNFNEFRVIRTDQVEILFNENISAEADGNLIDDICTKVEIIPSILNVFVKNQEAV